VTRVLIDSTCVVDVLRGRPGAIERLRLLEAEGAEPLTCAIVAAEVSAGLLPRERDAAAFLFEGLGVAELGTAEGRLAGWWLRENRRRGRTLTLADCLIAAAAVGSGARLATGNPKDFPMKELELDPWPVG
jgi:predicted nucleic acid-binding protein